jgi:lambda repressor-like predicted transcriptional regulator
VDKILGYTSTAVKELIETVAVKYPGYEIHSCKLNSGLFKVPWEKTETIIREALDATKGAVPWVVWEYP